MSCSKTPFLISMLLALAVFPLAAFGAASVGGRIAIHTDDGKLPASFAAANLSMPLKCLTDTVPNAVCSAWMMDVTDDGVPDVIILDDNAVWVFTEKPAGKWLSVGQWSLSGACQKFLDAARGGQFQMITPQRPRWADLEIAGVRFGFRESSAPPPPCPN